MTRDEFVCNIIFHNFKDKPYMDSEELKYVISKILNRTYYDELVSKCYIKIINYQIDRYGSSLYSDIVKRR